MHFIFSHIFIFTHGAFFAAGTIHFAALAILHVSAFTVMGTTASTIMSATTATAALMHHSAMPSIHHRAFLSMTIPMVHHHHSPDTAGKGAGNGQETQKKQDTTCPLEASA